MLNESQKRHVAATLRVTEEQLLGVREHVTGEAASTNLSRYERDIDDEERTLVTRCIDEALTLIDDVKHRFSLPQPTRSLRKTIVAVVTLIGADLTDVKAERLRAYGDADPDIRTTLDPLIDALIKTLESLTMQLGAK